MTHDDKDPQDRLREKYDDPMQLLEIEGEYARLKGRRSELHLPDHPAVSKAWDMGEQRYHSGQHFKTASEWGAAGESMERARAKLVEAFEVDKRAGRGRDRAKEARRTFQGIEWTDHPRCDEVRDRLATLLGAEDGRGRWADAWESGDLEAADKILEEVEGLLGNAQKLNQNAAESIGLAARCRKLVTGVPSRALDVAVRSELDQRIDRCRSAIEDHENGRFEPALATFRAELDPLRGLLSRDEEGYDEAMQARGRFEQGLERRPRNRPLSEALADGLQRLTRRADVAQEALENGEFARAAESWNDAAQAMGGLVSEDLAVFAEVEKARQAYEEFELAGRVRRAMWSKRVEEFAAIRDLAMEASGSRDAGAFQEATARWQEAKKRLGIALGEDASRHREAIVSLERFHRRLQAMPPRLLDQSVRGDAERIVKRRAMLDQWLEAGKFTEVEEAVRRSTEALERLLEADNAAHQAAVDARNEASAVVVDLPSGMPNEVQAALRPEAAEIDAIETAARQAFELGEYADSAAGWRTWTERRRAFGVTAGIEQKKHFARQRRRAVLRGVAAVILVALIVVGGAEGWARWRMSGLESRLAALPATNHLMLADRLEGARAEVEAAKSGAVLIVLDVLNQAAPIGDRITALEIDIPRSPVIELSIDERPRLGERAGLPSSLIADLDRREQELIQARVDWEAGNFDAAEAALTGIVERESGLAEEMEESRAARAKLDQLQPVDEFPQNPPEVMDRVTLYVQAVAAAEAAWDDRRFGSAEEQVRLARDRAEQIDEEIERQGALAARVRFDGFWNDPVWQDGRAAASKEEIAQVDMANGRAQKRFETRQFADAAIGWNEAFEKAQDVIAQGSMAAQELFDARSAWEKRDEPGSTARDAPLFKRLFDRAQDKAEVAASLWDDRKLDEAREEYVDALKTWTLALAEIDRTLAEKRAIMSDSGRSARDQDNAADWILRNVDPEDSTAQRLQTKLAWKLTAPRSKMNRTFIHPTKDVEIDLVYVPRSQYRIGHDLMNGVEEVDFRRITISKGFWIGCFEITRGQFAAILGLPEPGDSERDLPVVNVSPRDAERFCRELGQLTAVDVAERPIKLSFRLPTETEWEIAARGGELFAVPDGKLEDSAWFRNNSRDVVASVGTRDRNDFDLHDVLGNAEELCYDHFVDNRLEYLLDVDPGGPPMNDLRVVRGGHFGSPFSEVTLHSRRGVSVGERSPEVGFRVVFTEEPEPRRINAEQLLAMRDPLIRGRVDEDLQRREIELGRDGDEIKVEFVRLRIGDGGKRYLWVSRTEVPQRLWNRYMDPTNMGPVGPDLPAVGMTFYDARDFFDEVRKANPELSFRLPTLEEWQAACGSGGDGPYCFGSVDRVGSLARFGHVDGGADASVRQVGELRSSFWGLYDMHGNAAEWCDTERRERAPNSAPVAGGSIRDGADAVRSDRTRSLIPVQRDETIGFRLVADRLPRP